MAARLEIELSSYGNATHQRSHVTSSQKQFSSMPNYLFLSLCLILGGLFAACSSIAPLFPAPPPITPTPPLTPTVHVPQVSNGLIAFIEGSPETTFHIYTMNPDGTNKQRLIENTEYDSSPVWSPDGKHILFWSECLQLMSFESKDKHCIPFDMKALLGENYQWKGPLIWSPDGTKITFLAGQSEGYGSSSVYVMNEDGSDLHEVSQGLYALNPSWSTDSKHIVFSDVATLAGHAHIVHADGSHYLELKKSGYDVRRTYWSKDGKHIFYQAIDGWTGGTKVYVIDIDGSNVQYLLKDNSEQFLMGLSPDRSQLLIATTVWEDEHKVADLVLIDADDYSIRQYFQSKIDYSQIVTWLPDSKQIVYQKFDRDYYILNMLSSTLGS